MRAYKETYLFNAATNLGRMLDYAVNDCKIDGKLFLHMFIASELAEQFERGNPRVISGMSGIELAVHVIESTSGKKPQPESSDSENRSPEYWAGWALAHYQWYTAMSFSSILRFLPFDDILRMYPTLHEADISKFYASADSIRESLGSPINLKRIREAAGLSQSQLAKEADVTLRSIQMYEQCNKDINNAKAITLAKLARALSCDVEDLLENEK